MSESNDNSSESMGSDILLQPSRIVGGGFGIGVDVVNPLMRTGVLRPSLLGPSRLSKAASNNSSTNFSTTTTAEVTTKCESVQAEKVKSDVKTNPFLKFQDENNEEETTDVAKFPSTDNKNKDLNNSETNDDLADPMSMLKKNGFERANLFAAAKSSIPLVEKSGFVFGQNVHERVVGENVKPDSSGKAESNDQTGSDSGQLLFSSVIQSAAAKPTGENNDTFLKNSTETKSLTEVAREYEESRAKKRTFEEVETFTGEENEVNILDVNCKLFAFVNSNWEERGRGSLRLNDSKNEQECSRLVFRTAGNLRLLLNTKVWGDMDAARPSLKSLRLTAMDNTGKIKIFLVMARPAEISQLLNALTERINKRKLLPPEKSDDVINDANNENGITKYDVEKAATVVEPDQEDSNEPTPKRGAMQYNEKYTNDESVNENSNNN